MTLFLDLYRDRIPAADGARCETGGPRMVYLVEGSASVAGHHLGADEGAWSDGPVDLAAGDHDALCWRFELSNGDDGELAGVDSRRLLRADLAPVDIADGGEWLMRLDSVAFPPGGCALLHTHQGPGIRCLREGSIRIDSEGHSTGYGIGEPWFEAGPEPVFAAADATMPSRFIRAMVLPGHLAGRSSIRYVREEDHDKPKSQSYRVYAEQRLHPASS